MRTVGFLVFATNLIPLLVMKPLFLPQGKRTFDKSIFKDRVCTSRSFPFPSLFFQQTTHSLTHSPTRPNKKKTPLDILFSLSNVIGWLGVQIPLFYTASYGVATQHLPESTAFYLLAVLGAGSLPGRLLAPLLGDATATARRLPLGPLGLYPLFLALAGVLALAWTRVASYRALVAVALLYGFAYGGVVSLPPPAVAAMTRDVRQLGTRIGLAFSCAGVSVLAGPPIAGAIERAGGGGDGFTGVFAFAGAMMLAGSVCLAGVAWLNRREKAKEMERDG